MLRITMTVNIVYVSYPHQTANGIYIAGRSGTVDSSSGKK